MLLLPDWIISESKLVNMVYLYIYLRMYNCCILCVCSSITFERRMFFKHREAHELEMKNSGETKSAELPNEPSKHVETSVDDQNITNNETSKSTLPVAKRSRKT